LVFELNEILVKACAADTRQRYQTAAQMHADLALLQSGQSVTRRRTLERRFALGRKIGLAALVLMLVVAGVYFSVGTLNRRTAGAQRSSPDELAALQGTNKLEAYKKYVKDRTEMRDHNLTGISEGHKLMNKAVAL